MPETAAPAPAGPARFAPERRAEGPDKLTGAARYTADLHAPGALELAYVLADDAHAAIEAVDVSAAQAAPGVRLVLTGADLPGMRTGRLLLDQPVLAERTIRFSGERVAVVAAETRAQAEAAARLVRVRTRPLAPLLDPRAMLAPDAPVLHPDAAAYRFLLGERRPVSHPNLHGEVLIEREPEALAAAFASAPHVFEHAFTTQRQHAGYLEPHATLVEPLPDGRLRVHTSNKNPFFLRLELAATLGLPPDRLVVELPYLGGDFGAKGTPLDEPICCLIAQRTGRAVRHAMSYEEELRAVNPRHAAHVRLRTALDPGGAILAHEADVVFDGGAYAAGTPTPALIGGVAPDGPPATLAPYAVPAACVAIKEVYTTSVPAGHVRAPGEAQMLFAGERHLDLIAHALAIDPLALRRRNAVREGSRSTGGLRFRSPRAVAALDALAEARAAAPARPAPPQRRARGRGVSLGFLPIHGGRCAVRLRVRDDGRVELLTAQPNQGGGSHTALRRIAARALERDEDDVLVRLGDTDEAPFDIGSAASRVTWVAGQATLRAATELKERLARGASGDELVVEVAYDGRDLGHDPVDACFWAYDVEVEVDLETGAVALLGATLAADVGTIVNPVAHAGQLQGCFAMGIGYALMEELALDAGRVTTTTLAHYKLPNALDVPDLRVIRIEDAPGPGPFGAKPVGELNVSGVAPAIANAIADACGAQLLDLPLTAERVHGALAAATT